MLFRIVLEILSNNPRKGNKKHTDWKGRNKTIPVSRWHDYLENSKESIDTHRHTKYLLELSGFSRTQGQHDQSFIYKHNEQLEIEIF